MEGAISGCLVALPSLSASSPPAALCPAAAEPAVPAGASQRRCRGGRTRQRAAAAQHRTYKEINITHWCPCQGQGLLDSLTRLS